MLLTTSKWNKNLKYIIINTAVRNWRKKNIFSYYASLYLGGEAVLGGGDGEWTFFEGEPFLGGDEGDWPFRAPDELGRHEYP